MIKNVDTKEKKEIIMKGVMAYRPNPEKGGDWQITFNYEGRFFIVITGCSVKSKDFNKVIEALKTLKTSGQLDNNVFNEGIELIEYIKDTTK